MNPAQQQVFAQYHQVLQHFGGQLQGLFQQAAGGCYQMIAQNPSDPMPLNNAIGAIEQQVKGIRRQVSDAFSPHYDHVCAAGPGEPAYSEMKRAQRYWDIWADEAWMRFDAHWRVEQYRAMWPLVQQAMGKPMPCNRCGGPLRRGTPHKSESITCPACHTVNQVMPEAVVAMYYGGMPHAFSEYGLIDKRINLAKFKAQWEDIRDAEHAAGRDRPDEPLDRLKQREAMEKDYWTSYAEARVKNEGGTPEDVRTLVEARMKQCFYDEMNMNDVWRRANGMQSVAAQVSVPQHLQNVDEWGPLNPHQNPNALEDDFVHDSLLNEAIREPSRYEGLVKTLGYRDATHRAMVHATFMRHYGDFLVTPQGQQLVTKAAMRAMNERMKYMTAGAAAGGMLDPIEGVSLQVYAGLQAKQASVKPEEFQQMLAKHQMDMPKWERVAKGWIDRMSRDTTGAVATEYSKAFMGGAQNQYAAAGQAAADVMAQGQMGLSGPAASAEPVSFDKYCEISGAMQAWTKQGKDISAMLDKTFKISAMDVSSIGMYWSQKMMADLSMFDQQSRLMAQYEQKYLTVP
jgi:hypothetical protein